MTNNTAFDPNVAWARLGERVENQGKDIVDLRSNMNSGFQSLTASINSLSSKTEASISGLSNSLNDRARPQWAILISIVSLSWAILGGLGFMALQPIRESLAETKDDLRSTADKMVTQQELKWRSERAAEDRLKLESRLSDITGSIIPKDELNQRFSDQQRQLDQIREEARGH